VVRGSLALVCLAWFAGPAIAEPLPAPAATGTVYAASGPERATTGSESRGRHVARVILPAAPASALLDAVKAKLKPGEFRIAPNVLDLSRRGSKIRFYVRGTASATVDLAVFDEMGEVVGTVGLATDAAGYGVAEAGVTFLPGRELGAGRYRVDAFRGGVADKGVFLVARKRTR
jgi:hypothetical protein